MTSAAVQPLPPRDARTPLLLLAAALAAGALVFVRVHRTASPPPRAATSLPAGTSGPASPAAHRVPER